jgi:hypothetical protein
MAHTLMSESWSAPRCISAGCNCCLGLMEARMIEGRHIDHAQLLQLGKVLLLLVEREELLVNLPVVDQLSKKVVPIEELSRAS